MVLVAVLVLAGLIVIGCSHQTAGDSKGALSQVVSQSGVAGGDLAGRITKEDLYRHTPEYEKNSQDYQPKPEIIEEIKKINQKVEMLIVMGTWCPDCKKEVPKILRILDLANNPNLSHTLYAIGRGKKDEGGVTRKYNISWIPTTVFIKDGKELGRIVEYPQKSPEEEILAIAGSSSR